MPYEFTVGWRYLFGRRRSAVLGVALAAAALATALGGVLFAASPAKGAGILLLVFGSVATVAALLLRFFSAFTTISILGVALGVRTLAVVLSVSSGFQRQFEDKVLGINAHVLVMKYGQDFGEYEDVIKKVGAIRGVSGAAPFVLQELMIARGVEQTGVLVKGIDPARVGRVLDLPRQIEEGSLQALAGAHAPPELLLGRFLARRLHARRGDLVQLVSLGSDFVPGLSLAAEPPRARDFRVGGSFYSGFDEYDRGLVFMGFRDAQVFGGLGDVVTGVEMRLADPMRSGEVARQVEKALGERPYRIIDWRELNHNLFSALQLQKTVLAIVMTLIVLVAAFNIIAALTLLVLRKAREIAILKAQGMTSGGVARVFLVSGLSIGLIGVALGVAWAGGDCALLRRYGYPLDPRIYLIGRLPVEARAREFLLTAGVALCICVLATLYPASKAARVHPVDGLRQ
jgi:lipoprotein-releasing system permease protein